MSDCLPALAVRLPAAGTRFLPAALPRRAPNPDEGRFRRQGSACQTQEAATCRSRSRLGREAAGVSLWEAVWEMAAQGAVGSSLRSSPVATREGVHLGTAATVKFSTCKSPGPMCKILCHGSVSERVTQNGAMEG